MGLLDGCDNCYKVYLPECGQTLTIKAGLTPNTDYSYILSDKFDSAYQKYFTTDADGAFILDYGLFPNGYFTRFAGTFNLSVMRSNAYCEGSQMTFCSKQYDCLAINFASKLLYGPDSSSFTVEENFVIHGID